MHILSADATSVLVFLSGGARAFALFFEARISSLSGLMIVLSNTTRDLNPALRHVLFAGITGFLKFKLYSYFLRGAFIHVLYINSTHAIGKAYGQYWRTFAAGA